MYAELAQMALCIGLVTVMVAGAFLSTIDQEP